MKPPPRRPREPKAKDKPRRKPLPDRLERATTVLPLEECPKCGSDELAQLKPEVSEKLDYIRAHIRVRRIERISARCRGCNTPSTAPLPPTAVPGGLMTANFLAHIAYSKCGLHLPLARIIEDCRTQGVILAKTTLCDAMGHVAKLVEPLYDRIAARLYASRLIHLDGTGLKTLLPGQKGSYRGQVVVYCNEELTLYQFTESKHARHFEEFLRVGRERAYRGYLVADAASNMNTVMSADGIDECGCWYHLWDKFDEAKAGAPNKAAEAIAWIGTVFDVDEVSQEQNDTAEERLARRRAESGPLIEQFEVWMATIQVDFPPDEELYKAVQYFINHRTALLRFLSDGRIPMTNNLAERELGVIGRGRKNYLFAGSEEGGRRLAKVYTVVRTCQRMGIDPFEYLADVLPRLSDMRINRGRGHLDTLTPWGWGATRTAGA